MIRFLHHWYKRLFRVEVVSVQCTSHYADKSVILEQEYLNRSTAVGIRVSIRWPLLRWRMPTGVVLHTIAESGKALTEPHTLSLPRSIRGMVTYAALRVPGEHLRESNRVRLLVRSWPGRTLVSELILSSFDAESIKDHLKVETLFLEVVRGTRAICCENLHDQAGKLRFQCCLRLASPERSALLNQLGWIVTGQLCSSVTSKPIGSWSKQIQLRSNSFQWTEEIGSTESLFGGVRGNYVVTLEVKGQTLASKPIVVTSMAEHKEAACAQMKQSAVVRDLHFTAINHRKRPVEPDVVAEDFQCISVELGLEVSQIDPLWEKLPISFSVNLFGRDGDQSIRNETRSVTIRTGKNEETFLLAVTDDLFRHGEGEYRFIISMADRVLGERSFCHKRRATIKQEREEAILRSLRLEDMSLHVERDGQQIESDVVFETDRAIAPRFIIQGAGFDEDVPMFKWQLGITLVNLDTKAELANSISIESKAEKQLYDSLRLGLNSEGSSLCPGQYEIRFRKGVETLGVLSFRLLSLQESVIYTKRAILQSLRATNEGLAVHSDGCQYQCDHVPESSDYLFPRFTIHSSGYNSLVPRVESSLEVLLDRPGEQTNLIAEIPILLTPQDLPVTRVAIKVRGTTLGSKPGPCRLSIRVGQKDIAVFGFYVVTREDLLQHLSVEVKINAESKTGRRERSPKKLFLNEHRAIVPSVDITVGILAPKVCFPSSVVLQEGDSILARAEFALVLDKASKRIQLPHIGLQSLNLDQSEGERNLTLAVFIAEYRKAAHTVSVVNISRIANFEGRLSVHPSRLDVDDTEYQEILRGLR